MTSLSDLHAASGHINTLLLELRTLRVQLDVQIRESRDGYPTQSLGEGGGSGQVPEVDEKGREMKDGDGKKVMAPSMPHSDSVYAAVVARQSGKAGELSSAKRRVDQAILSARSVLESARGCALNALQPPKPSPEDAIAINGCTHHATIKDSQGRPVWAEIYDRAPTSGLCRWCYEHMKADGRRPPKEALVIHHEKGAREAGLWFARQEQLKAG